jgi:hypothetical protein
MLQRERNGKKIKKMEFTSYKTENLKPDALNKK